MAIQLLNCVDCHALFHKARNDDKLKVMGNKGLEVEVFAFFLQSPRYTLFGKEYQDAMPVTKRAEKEIMNSFVATFGKKPIGCTQK